MNGHQQRQNPHSPLALLYTHSANGEEPPAGFLWNSKSQLVRVDYQPWAEGPQIPWDNNFDNPDWVAFKKGDVTIERQPNRDPSTPANYGQDPLGRAIPPQDHSTVALVPNEAYISDDDDDDEEPTQENGTLTVVHIGSSGSYVRRNHRLTKSLVSYSSVPGLDVTIPLTISDPTKPVPLAVPPTQGAVDAAPVGGCISVSRFGVGHRGTQVSGLFDVPPGEVVRLPVGASFIQNDGLLVPKYYSFRTDANMIRIYLVFPGGPDLTNARWNEIDQSVLPANNATGDLSVSNPNGCAFMGWAANTAAYTNTAFSQAKRRFYGSTFTDSAAALPNPWALPAAAAGAIVQCPIAWYASQVTLIANPGLVFVFVGPTSTGGITQFTGPFPVNTPVQVPADAVAIWVYAGVKPIITGVVRIEVPFVLVYELSV